MRVRDVMTTDVTTIGPRATLREAAARLTELGVSGLPVVDDAGVLLGVISEADFLVKERGPRERMGLLHRLFEPTPSEELAKLEARTVTDAMTSPAITVRAEAPVARAAELMSERAIKRLPVVSADRLVGIVTRSDLVRAFARSDAEIAKSIVDDSIDVFWFPPGTVSATVEDGRVTLSGTVERRSQAEILAGYVRRVPGVLEVDSKLTWEEDDAR